MAAMRAIFAMVLAVSVALLPAAVEASVVSKSVEMSNASADTPCCPCCKIHKAKSSIACAFNCMSVGAAVLPQLVLLPNVDEAARPCFMAYTLHGYSEGPPTHPPPL